MSDARTDSHAFITTLRHAQGHHPEPYLWMRRPFKVVVCTITLVAFLFNTVAYDLGLLRHIGFAGQAWAVVTPSAPTSVGADGGGSAGDIRILNPNTFALPQQLGLIKCRYAIPSSSSVIVHIQDAHCNYYAQQKIADIIRYLNREYGISIVNLEGAARDYDLSVFTGIPNIEIRQEVADYFVKQGTVNGGELAAIRNPEKIQLWGVEDRGLYLESMGVYSESLKYKSAVDKDLADLGRLMTIFKTKIYSKELLETDYKYAQYKNNNLEFREYIAFLIDVAKKHAIDMKSYPNISLLSQAMEEEASIDFGKADNEKESLIDKLQKKLSKSAMEDLVKKTVEFKGENISQKDFYAYLVSKARIVNIDMAEYPQLQKYIAYVSIYESMDKMKAMDEMDALENKVRDGLYSNGTERTLGTLSKNMAILKNIFNMNLSRNDYRYYLANIDMFGMSHYKEFIASQGPAYGVTSALGPGIDKLDGNRREMSKFYEY